MGGWVVISKPRPGVVCMRSCDAGLQEKKILEFGVFMYSMFSLISQLEYILLTKFACDSLERLCEREEAR